MVNNWHNSDLTFPSRLNSCFVEACPRGTLPPKKGIQVSTGHIRCGAESEALLVEDSFLLCRTPVLRFFSFDWEYTWVWSSLKPAPYCVQTQAFNHKLSHNSRTYIGKKSYICVFDDMIKRHNMNGIKRRFELAKSSSSIKAKFENTYEFQFICVYTFMMNLTSK